MNRLLDARFSNIWRRIAAYLADVYVVLIAWLFLPMLFSIDTNFPNLPVLGVLIGLAQDLCFLAYRAFLHSRNGQTVGKMLVRVHVYSLSGAPISRRQAVLREIVPLILAIVTTGYVLLNLDQYLDFMTQTNTSVIPPWLAVTLAIVVVWQLVDSLPMLFTPRRRAIHDYIAGTIVVRDETVQAPAYQAGGSAVTAAALAFLAGPALLLAGFSLVAMLADPLMGLVLTGLYLFGLAVAGVPLILLLRLTHPARRIAAWSGLLGILTFAASLFAAWDQALGYSLRSAAIVGALAVLRVMYRRIKMIFDSVGQGVSDGQAPTTETVEDDERWLPPSPAL